MEDDLAKDEQLTPVDLMVDLTPEEEETPLPGEDKMPWSPTLHKRNAENMKNDSSLLDASLSQMNTTCSPKRTLFSSDFKTPDQKKKSRISFGSVEIRKYRVSHGGACGTPSKGAYPIGLSWECVDQETRPVDEEEKDNVVRKLSEKDRKRLLEKHDRRSYFEKQASFETEREELKQLRRARMNIGCGCTSANSCGTSKCICYKEGLACNDDSCKCSFDCCINPSRYNFDQDKVDNYRKKRIEEAPYTLPGVDENSFSPIKL